MAVSSKNIKIGTFKTPEEAFQKYKEYKEQYIKDTAKRYKDTVSYTHLDVYKRQD